MNLLEPTSHQHLAQGQCYEIKDVSAGLEMFFCFFLCVCVFFLVTVTITSHLRPRLEHKLFNEKFWE